ncbi:MAG: glutamine-hydrolyzing carbamoyl-phosphate synthase small subunit [Alphaproteobacteria bacterium]|jgi:carbamoyl-phosphate synthase small subunit
MTVLDNQNNQNYQNGFLIYNKEFIFKGKFLSSEQFKIAEICFNTSMTGYQEILTDPSYKSQFINFTFPLIGIVGCNNEDYESWKIHASGLICREIFSSSSNWRSNINFTNWLLDQKSCAFFDLDTRSLTKIIRDYGPKNVMLCSESYFNEKGIDLIIDQIDQYPTLEENDVIADYTNELEVSVKDTKKDFLNIAFLDFGAKDNIKKNLSNRNCNLLEFDMNFKAENILSKKPDGIFLSNGPGDPQKVFNNIKPELKKILESKIPTFGICLGHQILSLAFNAKTKRMDKGHRGGNHPVKNLETGQVEITSQNHGFVVSDDGFPNDLEISHISLFDNTVDGMKSKSQPLFSVQYHPESSPGPHDSRYLFDKFIELMKSNAS